MVAGYKKREGKVEGGCRRLGLFIPVGKWIAKGWKWPVYYRRDCESGR